MRIARCRRVVPERRPGDRLAATSARSSRRGTPAELPQSDEPVTDTLRAEGLEVQSEDVAQLSPLGYDHIMILRRYQFVVPESVQRGEFRPLRTPIAVVGTEDHRA